MSLLSLTLYAVRKTKYLFSFWFPVFKLKGGFGFIVHDDIGIEFIARIAFHAFDKVGLFFGQQVIEANYRQVKTDVMQIVESEMEWIKYDPDLQHLIQQELVTI